MIGIAYCTASEVRTLTGITLSDVSDSDLNEFISYAVQELNHAISVKVVRERVDRIDNTRTNTIDGSNTTFYVKHWKDYYIGDLNNDGTVDENDVIVYLVSGDGTETKATVSSVSPSEGKFVLASAPQSGVKMYVTYCYTPYDVSEPHALVKLACIYLTAALVYSRIDARKIQNFSIGKLKIGKQSQAFEVYYRKYMQIVNQIRRFPFKKIQGEQVTSLVSPGMSLKE